MRVLFSSRVFALAGALVLSSFLLLACTTDEGGSSGNKDTTTPDNIQWDATDAQEEVLPDGVQPDKVDPDVPDEDIPPTEPSPEPIEEVVDVGPDGVEEVMDVTPDELEEVDAEDTSTEAAPPEAGQLVVTEFMPRSQAGTDMGEWIELTNLGAIGADLEGCVLRDESSDVHVFGALVIPAGANALLAKSADPAENHGLEPDYVYADFNQGNGGDEIIIACPGEDDGELLIDAIAYTGAEVNTGFALQLAPDATDATLNDDMTNWCFANMPYGDDPALFGTPGADNGECASTEVDWCRLQWPVDETILAGTAAEIMVYGRIYEEGLTDLGAGVDAHPLLLGQAGYGPDQSDPAVDGDWDWITAQGNPEWIDGEEPGNDEYMATLPLPAIGIYDLAYRFSVDGGKSWTYCDIAAGDGSDGSEDGYQIEHAGDLEIQASPCDPNPCADVPADACAADGLILLTYAAACEVVDSAASCSYPETEVDCTADGKVCKQDTCAYADLDPAPPAGAVIVTEVMVKSQGGADPGEWIELHNVGDAPYNLADCLITDYNNDEHVIAESLPIAAGGFVVLAKSGDAAENHGLDFDYVYSGFNLGNGGDEIALVCLDVEIDAVETGGDWDVDGVAYQLAPTAYDAALNDDTVNWCPAATEYGTDGLLGTPGLTNDQGCEPESIDWCRLHAPLEAAVATGGELVVYGHVFEAGLTDQSTGVDAWSDLKAELGQGPDGSDPVDNADWTWIEAEGNAAWVDTDEPGNDEYMATLTAGAPGSYDYAYRASMDGGNTWTYCDGPGGMDGSTDGYAVEHAGALTVTPPTSCDPNPCTEPPAASCDGDTLTDYESPGACAEGAEFVSCDYAPVTTDCAAASKICVDGACVIEGQVAPSEAGQLVITEFMARSQSGSGDNGEWIELYNPTALFLDLNGCRLKDAGSDEHVISGLIIEPMQYALLAKSALPDENHGIDPDYVYTGFSLTNGGDEIILTCADLTIDQVVFSSEVVALAQSAQLDPTFTNAASNDDMANWCLSWDTFNDQDMKGTPGAANAECPATTVDWCRYQWPLDLTIALGEHLTGSGRVYVGGLTDESAAVDATPNLVAQLGLGPDATDPTDHAEWTWFDAAATPDWDGDAAGEPDNDEYMVEILPEAIGTWDLAFRFSLDGGATWVLCDADAGEGMDGSEDGYSPENAGSLVVQYGTNCEPNPCIDPPAASCEGDVLTSYPAIGTCTWENDAPVCEYVAETTDCTTDGKECREGACMEPLGGAEGSVIITEFMAKSMGGGSDKGEWIELYNTTDAPVDLNGCVLKDDGSDAHTLTGMDPIPAGGYVVLASTANEADNHGLAPDYVYSGTTLSNSSDEIVLSCGDVEVDRVDYTGGWVHEGVAFQLDPTAFDHTANDAMDSWCEAKTEYGTASMFGTPGAGNDSCAGEMMDWCRLQHPTDATVDFGAEITAYVRYYEADVTGQSPATEVIEDLVVLVGFGPDGSDPASADDWTWTLATANEGWNATDAGEPDNDEAQAAFTPEAIGTFDLAARVSLDDGASWLYCDTNAGDGADGSEDGYAAANAGNLVIQATTCNPNPCTAPPAASCDGDTLTTYGATGTCTVVEEAAQCDYAAETLDCTTEGKVCTEGACVTEGQGEMPGAAGDVIVTEFMAKSAAGSPDKGEWIELMNTTGATLDLNGCVLEDDGTDEHTIDGAPIMAPGDFLVLAASDDAALNHGLTPGYVYDYNLSNLSDEIVLTCGGVEIDRVNYTSSWNTEGVAFQLDPSKLTAADNDHDYNWCDATTGYGTADPAKLGTPGAINAACPDVCDPNPCDDAAPADACDGNTLKTFASPGACAVVEGQPICDYTLPDVDCAATSQICHEGACVTPADPCENNPCTTPPAATCDGDVLTHYASPGACTVVAEAAECEYAPATTNCADNDELCVDGACVPQGTGVAPAAGEVIVTEFMARSNAGQTDDGEWIELLNTSASPLDLNGCVLKDDGSDEHVLAGAPILAAGAYLVMAKSDDATANHGLTPDYLYSQSLTNSGDEIVLVCGEVEIDRVDYTSAWVTEGVAFQLASGQLDATANDDIASWCDAMDAYGSADPAKLGTPGAANHACDPCVPDPCTEIPAATCDGNVLTTYSASPCTSPGGTAVCDYPAATEDCTQSGKICEGAACVPSATPCDPNPCTMPPASMCDGDVLTSYATLGTCSVANEMAVCDYAPVVTNCADSDQICEIDACVTPPAPTPAAKGEVLVTEFMAKSMANTDTGEWVELYNTTTGALDLNGCVLKDDGSDGHTIDGAPILATGAYLVMAKSADSVENHGLTPDYIYNYTLSNSSDEIVLVCGEEAAAIEIDRVDFTNAWITEGVAIQLDPASMDADANDLLDNWCAATATYGTADPAKLGTPGEANASCDVVDPCDTHACDQAPANTCDGDVLTFYAAAGICSAPEGTPTCDYPSSTQNCADSGLVCEVDACVAPSNTPSAAGEVIVTEFMARSMAGQTDNGEWVELVNTTVAPLDLAGCLLGDDDDVFAHTINATLMIDGGGSVLLAKTSSAAENHGLVPDYVYASFLMANSADEIVLTCGDSLQIDRVAYDATWVTEGVAIQLDPASFDGAANDLLTAWCSATAAYGTAGKLGTPGAANAACVDDLCRYTTCTSAPDATCDGDVLTTYSGPGTCAVVTDAVSCTYPSEATNCADSQQICAEGMCVDATAQRPSAAGEVIVTEFMAQTQSGDDLAEWIELYNASGKEVTLQGCVLKDDGADHHVIADALTLADGAFVVLGRDADSTNNKGAPMSYAYGAEFLLANGDDEIVLSCDDLEIDRVMYDGWWVSEGTARQLDMFSFDHQENDFFSSWCVATDSYGADGMLGTPGAVNGTCAAPSAWCRLQWPLDAQANTTDPLDVYGRVYVGGVTTWSDMVDVDPSMKVAAGFGPVDTDPDDHVAWTWIDAVANPAWNGTNEGEPNNDEYMTYLEFDAAGAHDLAFRVSTDGGTSWTYCDKDAGDGMDGSEDGYQIENAGLITVSASVSCADNPSVCDAPPADACELNILTTYPALGTCVDMGMGVFECVYAPTVTNCTDSGQVCEDGACVTATGRAPAAAGELVITEFMARSMSGTDTGEWIELLNTTGDDLDLNGCFLHDDGTDNYQFTEELLVAAGHYLVLASSDVAVENHGLTPDHVYSGITLANGDDEIVFFCGATQIDRVNYTSDWVTLGAALALDPDKLDEQANDSLASWCTATATYGDQGKLGTPGAANDQCPELAAPWCRYQWPLDSAQEPNHPFDVYGRVYVAGLTNQSDGVDSSPLLVGQAGSGPADSDPTDNAQWTWTDSAPTPSWSGVAESEPDNDEYTAALTLTVEDFYDLAFRFSSDGGATWVYCDKDAGDGADGSEDGYQIVNGGKLMIVDEDACVPNPCGVAPAATCDGSEVVTYTGDGTCNAVTGEPVCTYAETRVDCATTSQECSEGACVTPGTEAPGAVGDLVITEIMPRSQSGASDPGEWFELHNPTTKTFDLQHCWITDKDSDDFQITETLLMAPGEDLLFAGNGDSTTNHGITPDFVYSGMSLSNSSDEIIVTCGATEIDRVDYTSAWVQLGVAWQLNPDQIDGDNASADNWCAATSSYGGDGMLGTPGAANDPCLPALWGRLQYPLDHTSTFGTVIEYYARVYVEGITDQTTFIDVVDPSVLKVQMGYGPADTDPDGDVTWVWTDAIGNAFWVDTEEPNNDEYITYVDPIVGVFDTCFRFSLDNGVTWTYADRRVNDGSDGTSDGYQIENAGTLQVTL